MINIYYSPKGTPYIWASELNAELEIGTKLNTCPRMIEYGFVENQDYSCHHKNVTTAIGIKKAVFDWAVQFPITK